MSVANEISKSLETKETCRIDVAIKQVKGLIKYLEKYRESGFSHTITSAKKIANEMDIECVFVQKHGIRRKKTLIKISLNAHNQTLSMLKSLLGSIIFYIL